MLKFDEYNKNQYVAETKEEFLFLYCIYQSAFGKETVAINITNLYPMFQFTPEGKRVKIYAHRPHYMPSPAMSEDLYKKLVEELEETKHYRFRIEKEEFDTYVLDEALLKKYGVYARKAHREDIASLKKARAALKKELKYVEERLKKPVDLEPPFKKERLLKFIPTDLEGIESLRVLPNEVMTQLLEDKKKEITKTVEEEVNRVLNKGGY